MPPRDLGRVLSLQHDAVVARLIDFSIWQARAGAGGVGWLDLGSAARREFTLASDQDNALAYADAAGSRRSAQDVDAYFARLGADVNDGLARCGIGVDNNGVLAGNRLWRMSKDAWLRTFDECLREPDESHLIRATVAFDFRPSAGRAGHHAGAHRADPRRPAARPVHAPDGADRDGLPGRARLPRPARDRAATAIRPGRLDLKRGGDHPARQPGALPRAGARGHDLRRRSTGSRRWPASGGLERDVADALREAFVVITGMRFEHHAAQMQAGLPPDNLIDPERAGADRAQPTCARRCRWCAGPRSESARGRRQ